MFEALDVPGNDPEYWEEMGEVLAATRQCFEGARSRALERHALAAEQLKRVQNVPEDDPERATMLLEACRREAKAATWVDTYDKLVIVYTRLAVIALEHRVDLDYRRRRGEL